MYVFYFFPLYGGSGLRCQTRLFPLMFSFPCYLDDHERDFPPRRVIVFGLATNKYTEYKKQQRTTTTYYILPDLQKLMIDDGPGVDASRFSIL